MDDIVPGLLDEMKKDFQSQYDGSTKVKKLKEKLNSGNATYAEANEYASEVGEITKKIYEKHLTSENLPDGKCYYNIAERVTSSTLHDQYELVADYTEQVQTNLNKKAGIGLKAQRADEDKEGYHSLANYMSSASTYTSIAKSVAQSAERFARSTVDNSVKKNAEFQNKAGMKPKIVRSGGSGCCAWCSGLSGTYDYPKVPKDVYARHNNCTCTVEYDPGSGKRQDVHTKQWRETDSETLQRRQTVGLDENLMEYRHERDRNKTVTASTKEGSISAKQIKRSPNGIFVSDALTIKPKKIQEIENNISEFKKLLGTNGKSEPIIILVADTELGNAGGRFDAATNTIYYKVFLDKSVQRHVNLHEMYHWEDAQQYVLSGNVITSNDELINYECIKSKNKLDILGVNADNVGNISEYAEQMFEKGRYDEVYTEYRTVKQLR